MCTIIGVNVLRRFALAVCISARLWTVFASEPGRDIIAKAVEAERENRRHMVNYLFVEDISRRAFDRDGNLLSDTGMSYEVLFIEGRPAFRKTSIDGRALTREESETEEARLR